MQIRVGYELIYDCLQPTPMMLMLNIHLYARFRHRNSRPFDYHPVDADHGLS
jgi:hypothetical protein